VMRRARIPHATCGGAPVRSRLGRWLGWAAAPALLLACATLLTLSLPRTALAQDPSLSVPQASQKSSFPKQPGGIFGPAPKIDRAQPLYMQADQLIYDTKGNRVIAQGNVEIYYNNFILTADQVIYDQGVNKLIAEGNAQLKDPNGSITRADRLEALDDFRDAFVQSLSVVTKDDTRIAAQKAVRREGNVTEFERGRFTPCRSDEGMPPLWCLSAARIVHDQKAATITYQDAQFELFGVPILYFPYFQHPDPSVKRQSGFLMPGYSNSSTLGFSVEVPYYFAIAPNADFTFHPKWFSEHGVLWQGEWRHRLATGQYNMKIAAIDDDAPEALSNEGWRGSIETKGQFSLSSWWRYGWDVTLESDESFRRFYRLDPILQTDRVNVAYLQGMSERNYFSAKMYHFGSLLFQESDVANSRVHPVIDYDYIVGTPVVGGELSFTTHARAMTRTDGTNTNHALVEANWRRKMIDSIGQVWTPFGNVRGDVYSWTDARDPNNPDQFIPDDTILRGTGQAGMLYSYPFVAHAGWASHVFEPTAQVIVRPNRIDQRRTPDEDARSLVFDDTLLFDIDRFSGYDRLETGTRLNVGIQYTMQGNNGMYARAVFGQSIHLAGDNAFVNPGNTLGPIVDNDQTYVGNFSPDSGLQNDRSDYVAGLYMSPFSGLSLVTQGRFDENDWSLRRNDTYLQANYGPLLAQVGYTYTSFESLFGEFDAQQEILGTLGFRLTDRWSVLGQMRYDITDERRVQDLIQLKYQDECFVLTASYIETFVENEALDLRPDRTLMLRFELKHLGEFNYRTDRLDYVFGDANRGPAN
jgi:LPS-assembly protein